MAAMPVKIIEHFTHPGHPLEEFYAGTEFLCNGCKTHGAGPRFRCQGCDFDLHDYCGTCPRSLFSFIHLHPLSLDVGMAQGTSQNEHVCDVCGEFVEGLCYQCKDCEFNVHPLCTKLPQQLRHVLDKSHPLKLQKISSLRSCAVCSVCRGACDSWRYRCEICGFDIHMECVLILCGPPPGCDLPTQRTIPKCGPSTDPPQPPALSQLLPYDGACQPPALSQLLPYDGACPGPVPSPSPNNMHVNPVQPYGLPLQPAPPHDVAYNYGMIPSGPNPYNNYANQATEGGATHGRKRKKIYEIAKQLSLGVASNVIFGTLSALVL